MFVHRMVATMMTAVVMTPFLVLFGFHVRWRERIGSKCLLAARKEKHAANHHEG